MTNMLDVHFHFPDIGARTARLQAVPRPGEAVCIVKHGCRYRVERVEWTMVEHELQPVQVFLSAAWDKPRRRRWPIVVIGLLMLAALCGWMVA